MNKKKIQIKMCSRLLNYDRLQTLQANKNFHAFCLEKTHGSMSLNQIN